MSHSPKVSNEKSLVQFDYEKAVSNYLGTQSTFNSMLTCPLPPQATKYMSEDRSVAAMAAFAKAGGKVAA